VVTIPQNLWLKRVVMQSMPVIPKVSFSEQMVEKKLTGKPDSAEKQMDWWWWYINVTVYHKL